VTVVADGVIPALQAPAERPAREARLPFRPDIEGLRAVAILFVVLFHAGWRAFGGGFFGVDVFFVLSGFLITGIILEEIERTGTLSLVNFWARRARRLLPAAILVTLFVLAADSLLRISLFIQILIAQSAQAFAVYGSNVLFAIRSTDYFGGMASRDPLLHTWSLSVEEQFYLFFAPMMLLLAGWARAHGSGVYRGRLVKVLAVLSVLSLAGCLVLARRYPVIAFYSLPPRAWQFGMGALACFGLGWARRTDTRLLEVVSALAFIGLVFAACVLREGRVAPLGLATLVPTLGTVALLLAGAGPHRTLVARALSVAPMRLIGRLSYSWYLWHWPFMVYLRELRPSPPLALSLGVALLSLVPAALTYALVETPVRYSSWLPKRPRLVLAGAVTLAALTVVAGKGAVRYANSVLSSPRVAKVLAARERPRVYADGCVVPLLEVTPKICEYGPATNDTTVVLFGDSHAAHWFPAFDSVARARGWKLESVIKLSCPSTTVAVTNLGRRFFECDQWRELAIQQIIARRPTIVVLVDDKTYTVVMEDQNRHADSSDVARQVWHDGLLRTISALRPSGARLVMLADTPHPVGDVPQCLVKHIDEPHQCDSSARTSYNAADGMLERTAARDAGNVSYISLVKHLCDATTCPASRDGMVRYSDSNHLSVAFSASLAPYLSDELNRALAEPGLLGGDAAGAQ
jgi:peptidoglycan/LPS O-acetylase OafA/YrhL